MPKSRRGRCRIIQEILDICREGTNKTRIMYRANLSFSQLEKYLEFLEENGLIEKNGNLYETTDKGLEVYRKIRDCYSFLS